MAAGASMAGGVFEGSGWSIGIAPGDLRGRKPRNQPISPPSAGARRRPLLARGVGVERRDLLRDVVAPAVQERHRRVEGGVLGTHPLLDPVEADLERVLVLLVAIELLAEAVGLGRQGTVDAEHRVGDDAKALAEPV